MCASFITLFIFYNLKMLHVASDFTGIGSFEIALKRLKIPFKMLFCSEIDKNAIKILEKNTQPGCKIHGDITQRDFGAFAQMY